MRLIVAFYVKSNTPPYVTPCGVPAFLFSLPPGFRCSRSSIAGLFYVAPRGSDFGGFSPARFLQIAISLIVPTRTQGIILVGQASIAVWVKKAREGLVEKLRLSAQ